MVFGSGVSASIAGSVPIRVQEADMFDGQERVHTALCCSSDLVKYVSKQLRDESLIAMEARKAREEKALVRQLGHTPAAAATLAADEVVALKVPLTLGDPKKTKEEEEE